MSGTLLTRLVLGALLALQAVALVYFDYYPAMWKYHVKTASDYYTAKPANNDAALAELKTALGDCDHFAIDGRRAFTYEALGVVAAECGQRAEARRYNEQALELYSRFSGGDSEEVQRVRDHMAGKKT
jgi:hypothetical protein